MLSDNLPELHKFLSKKLSSEEVKTLCLNLEIDYDDLPSGGGKSDKIREMLLYLKRRGRLSDLTEAVGGVRPDLVELSTPDVVDSSVQTPDDSRYQKILELCYQTGVEMERLPSVYAGKDEEALRDHFVMVLTPNFDSVTGETFNRKGKTDILIRHEKDNIFVAECKFWKGKKVLLSTIDQALGYLTWRDSKAALLIFVKNREFGSVLAQIDPIMVEHPCFVRSHGRQRNGWYNYDFHLLEDSASEVSLAVLCFHFPS